MDLNGSGLSTKKKAIEEYESDVPSKDNKSEGEAKCAAGALCNEEKSDSFNDINENMDDVEIMRG